MARVAMVFNEGLLAVALSDAVLVLRNKVDWQPLACRPEELTTGGDPMAIPSVIAVTFNGDRSLMVVVYGDKMIRVWESSSGRCIASHKMGKKLTSVAVAPLPAEWAGAGAGAAIEVALVGDKTGDVWALPLPGLGRVELMLGHTASIITGLAVWRDSVSSGGDQWRVASSDRDEKVRVSRWPETTCIDSFCLGHVEYVSAVVVAAEPTAEPTAAPTEASTAAPGPCPLLLSMSGDGTVRCWKPAAGRCVGRWHFPGHVPVALAARGAVAAVALAGSTAVSLFDLLAADEGGDVGGGGAEGGSENFGMAEAGTIECGMVPTSLALGANALFVLGARGLIVFERGANGQMDEMKQHPFTTAVRDAMGTAEAEQVGATSFVVLPALSLADRELDGDDGDDDAAGGAGDGEAGDGDEAAAPAGASTDKTSELRKREIEHPRKDWNLKKRFTGPRHPKVAPHDGSDATNSHQGSHEGGGIEERGDVAVEEEG